MGRSVVRAGAARCPGCSQPPRLCVCDLLAPVETGIVVRLLIHRHERNKPSSTGALVARTVTGCTSHLFQRATRQHPALGLAREAVGAGGEPWILDPAGEPLTEGAAGTGSADRLTVVIVDGTWREAGEMTRSLNGLGRRVRLADPGARPARFWLRDQPGPTHLSSAEALMGVLGAVGETAAEERLRLHFELHVYATLLARGRREMAERYLGDSPLLGAGRDALDRFHARSGGAA
ncbi:MAG: DTW domain-containing protein [Pirellulales bacterium]